MKNGLGVEGIVEQFLKKANNKEHRYRSQELCYQYFYSAKKKNVLANNNENLQLSCLHLAAYLASWGMYRGSSFLLKEKNFLFYESIVNYISELDIDYWGIDVNDYSTQYKRMVDVYERLAGFLRYEDKMATDTRVTKVMLGVFSNVPAFDQYFKKSMGIYNGSFEKKLSRVLKFYNDHESELKKVQYYLKLEYGKKYSFAKIIDMYGFQKGLIDSVKNK